MEYFLLFLLALSLP